MSSFWFKCVIVTSITLVLTWASSMIAELRIVQLLFPETIAIKEFEFTDFAFDLKSQQHINEQITIINIGELDRRGIAALINTLNNYEPKVIGLDILFNCYGDTTLCPQYVDPEGSNILRQAIRQVDDIVLVSHPLRSEKMIHAGIFDSYDSVELSDTMFTATARTGHTILSTEAESENDVQACRTFDPVIELTDGTVFNAFGVEVAMYFDSARTKDFLERFRTNNSVPINFKGNIVKHGYEHDTELFREVRHFHALDAIDILAGDFPPHLVRNRVLLLEYVGTTLTSPAAEKEKFYTPLNRKKIGRTFPDMYPSVVHANIVNMIITGDYIYELSELQEFVFTALVCLLHVATLLGIRIRRPQLHDLVAFVLVILIIGLIALLRLILFAEFNIKSDLTFTIGSLALAGIVVAIYHDILDSRLRRLVRIEPEEAGA